MAEELLVVAPSARRVVATRRKRRLLYPWDLLLPGSVALWALGVSRLHPTRLGEFGLIAILPIVFWVGLGLLVVSIGWVLAQAQPSSIRLTVHLGALILMLYGTAPLVYDEGRYAWLYKYIGVVQYINLHGHVNQNIDIFQDWPGFFAVTAWFDKVVGVQSPLAYAKWAQLAFELLTCLLLSFVFRALPLNFRERWLALFLYAGSMWVAQDYLSAQAVGVLLSTGIFALALNFLLRDAEARWVTRLRKHLRSVGGLVRQTADHVIRQVPDRADETVSLVQRIPSRAQDSAVLTTLFIVYFVLVFEHELSPFVVVIQLGGLAIIGRLRHRWMVIVLAAIVLGYLGAHFTFVNQRYGLLASFGNFFGNAAASSAGFAHALSSAARLQARSSHSLTLVISALGAVGVWRMWRSRRSTLPLVILAITPVFVLVGGDYGGEGSLRVYLFSLPWIACLAAVGLNPVAAKQSWLGVLRAPAALAITVALFIPAFFGNDYSDFMSRGEVNGVLAFYQTAPPGTIVAAADNYPGNINGRYPLFGEQVLFGAGGILSVKHPMISNGVALTLAIEQQDPNPKQPEYVLISSSMQAFGTSYGFLAPHELQTLSTTLDHAAGWFRIYHTQDLTVFELPPLS
jgi:hypothetical protein